MVAGVIGVYCAGRWLLADGKSAKPPPALKLPPPADEDAAFSKLRLPFGEWYTGQVKATDIVFSLKRAQKIYDIFQAKREGEVEDEETQRGNNH